jgi:hypothetical protein
MTNTRKRRNAETSKFKGVSWCAGSAKWRSQICLDNHVYHLGLFAEEIAAAKAYDRAAKKMFGEFASPNF